MGRINIVHVCLIGFICGILACIAISTQETTMMWSFTFGFVFGIAFIVGSMAWHLRPTQRR